MRGVHEASLLAHVGIAMYAFAMTFRSQGLMIMCLQRGSKGKPAEAWPKGAGTECAEKRCWSVTHLAAGGMQRRTSGAAASAGCATA